MICVICGSHFQPLPTWTRLIVYKLETSTCTRCISKFEKADQVIDFNDFIGTPYEGAVDEVLVMYTYNEAMIDYFHQYKFLQDVALAQVFAEELHETFEAKEGIVVPIPMHPDKLLLRTFAQVDELLNCARTPFQHVLEKIETSEQGKKSKKERLDAKSLFKVSGNVEAKTYILFDDIYTTGATIHHAAKALKDAGATRIEAVTLIKG